MKNVLITGSLGFIGKHTQEAFKQAGYKTLGIDKKAGIDLTQFTHLKQTVSHLMPQIDFIVHLAGTCSTSKSLVEPGQELLDNVIGTFHVLELAKDFGNVPVIYTSTCKIKQGEDGSRTPYGLSKFIAEEYVKEWNKTYDVPFIINRPGTVYGAGQTGSPESGWLSWFIKASILSLPLTIYGDGKQVRDVLHVADYVKLLLDQVKNFEKYKGQTFNVGGGKENAVDLLKTLEFLNYKNYNFDKTRKGDVKEFIADNQVSKITGWTPKIGWEEGIRSTFEQTKAYLAKAN